MEIPIGYRFSPSDVELVSFYLKNKATGQPLPLNPIIEREVYGDKSPLDVFYIDDPWVESVPGKSTKMSLYVFTTLKYLSDKTVNERIARKAGRGTWHGETGSHRQDVVDSVTGVVIGKKQTFKYVSRDESLKGSKGHWYMHEYALTGSSMSVLCKITRDDSKLLKVETPPSEAKKKTARVYDEECVNSVSNTMSTEPQAYVDGFSEEGEADSDFTRNLEANLMSEDDQEYQGGTNQQSLQDLDLDKATRMTQWEATLIHVSDQEGGEQTNHQKLLHDDQVANTMCTSAQFLEESCTIIPLPDHDFPQEDLFDDFSEEYDMMLMEERLDCRNFKELPMIDNDQEYQRGTYQPSTHDLDYEHAAKRMRYDTTRIYSNRTEV